MVGIGDDDEGELGFTALAGQVLRLQSNLELDSRIGIGCVGAVLAYLQRLTSSLYLPTDHATHTAYHVRRLKMFTLRQTMFVIHSTNPAFYSLVSRMINANTLQSLQIIRAESHPNLAKQGPGTSGAKESLSVYGLFHHFAHSAEGRKRLRQIFLRPSLDIGSIRDRLDFVSVGTQPANYSVVRKLSKSLAHIGSVKKVMIALRKGIEGGARHSGSIRSATWHVLLAVCYHGIDIADTLKELEGACLSPTCIRAMHALDKSELQRIGKMMHDIVDLEASVEHRRTVIRRGVSDALDQVKDLYDGIEEVLGRIADEITSTMPQHIIACLSVVYLPQLGFFVTLPLTERGQPIYTGGLQAWQRCFITEQQVYFKTRQTRKLDEEMGDLYGTICSYEIEISFDLAQRVLEDEQFLVDASDICAELDALLALVHGAIEYKLVRPDVVDDNIIKINGGRHILQETVVHSFIPNDTLLAGGRDAQSGLPSMVLLTGPNYSGKSVYQKQVALIIYLAQIGSFVPAERAIVGMTDKILTRISTRETVSKMQSAFMIDLQQVAKALRSATSRSLVVLDEVGKGTATCDGAGLAAAVFTHFANLGHECPKVLASTHFHESLKYLGGKVWPAHMEVQVSPDADMTINVVYLYSLRSGHSSMAYGTQCAALNGIPQDVVKRAEQLARQISNSDLVAICSSMGDVDLENLAEAEKMCRELCRLEFNEANLVRDQLEGLVIGNSPICDQT